MGMNTARLIDLSLLRWRALAVEVVRFGLAGVLGLCVDITVVYSLCAELGLYGAGVVAYFAATSLTWALNRRWTFAGRGSGTKRRQWLLFLAANSLGFCLNRGAFFLLVAFNAGCAKHPIAAIIAGSVAGMGTNFVLSRKLVFGEALTGGAGGAAA